MDSPGGTWPPTKLPAFQFCKDTGHCVAEGRFLKRKRKKVRPGEARQSQERSKERDKEKRSFKRYYITYMDNPSQSKISPWHGALTSFSVTPGILPKVMIALGGEKSFTTRPFVGTVFYSDFSSISCAFLH